MTIAAPTPAGAPSFVRLPSESGHNDDRVGAESASSRFAGYAGLEESSSDFSRNLRLDTSAFIRRGTITAASPGIKNLHDTMDLHDKVKLVDRAKKELDAFINDVRNDDSALKAELARMRSANPARNCRSEFTSNDVRRAMQTLFVAEAKKSGLYDEAKQAAIQRMKDSGTYENVVKQVLENEGPGRDRAWAEGEIERLFDYGGIEARFQSNIPHLEFGPVSGGGWGSVLNTGSAGILGDETTVKANGRFDLEFTQSDGQLFYTVQNRNTGITSPPRLYDARGTIIQADGLRAEMFGAPAPGDRFSFVKPSEYQLLYPSFGHSPDALDAQQMSSETRVFDSLFGPFHGGIDKPSQTIRLFAQQWVDQQP